MNVSGVIFYLSRAKETRRSEKKKKKGVISGYLQPSFWASVNNRESPSLDNPHILFANITERYSRNTNIFQLCRLIFQDLPGEKQQQQ